MDDDPALDQHVAFFDVNRDGRIEAPEIRQALLDLGFSRFLAAVLTPVLALLPSQVDEVRDLRHDDTGAFDSDGEFDEAAFEAWWRSTDRDGSGDLSRWELFLGSLKLADDPMSAGLSIAEFQLVHTLLSEDGGLTRQAVLEFLNGDLVQRLVAARDP